MLKKTIKYTDFNGKEQVEDHYFHLSKADIAEMELSVDGSFSEQVRAMIASGSGSKIIKVFKDILKASYGVRSEDGRRFIKTDQLWEEFSQTEAYSELFMELATNAEAGAAFMRGVMPSDLAEKAEQDLKAMEASTSEEQGALTAVDETVPAWIREDREPTQKELTEASPEQMRLAFSKKYGTAPK